MSTLDMSTLDAEQVRDMKAAIHGFVHRAKIPTGGPGAGRVLVTLADGGDVDAAALSAGERDLLRVLLGELISQPLRPGQASNAHLNPIRRWLKAIPK